MANEAGNLKCAHAPCNCGVEFEGEYCSDACSQADQQSGQASTEAAQCPCGHPDCG